MAPKKKAAKPEAHCGAGTSMLLGRPIAKEFKGFGVFKGHVTDFHRDTGYRVDYEDGDSEDLSEAGLLELLTERGPSAPLAEFEVPSYLPKRQTQPALILREFVAAARGAARRKRKHTELKRSGVFERKRQELEAAREAAAKAAAAKAARQPLTPPPSWALGLPREGRAVRLDSTTSDFSSAAIGELPDHDTSLFRLRLKATGETSVDLQWWFPPANPGNSGAWVGLFPAADVVWGAGGSPMGMASAGSTRVLYRLLTKNDATGKLKFSNVVNAHGKPVRDDLYVFTLHSDYGRQCRATSERFEVVNGVITRVFEGTLSSDFPSVNRKHRQQAASLNLLGSVHRSLDKDAEVLDERCYFPLTAFEVSLPERYADDVPMLKRVYAVVDKASFLDWGLTTDYEVGEEGRAARRIGASKANAEAEAERAVPKMGSAQYSSLPSAAAHCARRSVNGSEGYGEATMGSAHKIGVLLANLRSLVLHELHETHWNLLFDLGPHSTFLDIGSGYGKVVLHLRLFCRMRRAVGMECVGSRDEIAKKATLQLENEAAALKEGGGAAAAAGRSRDAVEPPPEPSAGASRASRSSGPSPTSSATEDAPSGALVPAFVEATAFEGVEFECADATAFPELLYTHIYIFDWVFSASTLRDMAAVLQRSPFYVLCSFRKVTEWWSYGLVKIQPVAKLSGFKTTGGEGMTCFVYVNVEKLPSQ